MTEKQAHGEGFGEGISVCEKDIEELNTEVSRLTDCLEETIDELLCGNRLHAELTDRYNDATLFLNSLQGTINELRESLASKQAVLDATLRANQASEQARQEAVRELEGLKVRYDLLEYAYNQASGHEDLLQSRLSQAEVASGKIIRKVRAVTERRTTLEEIDWVALACYTDDLEAALQPGEKGEK